MPGSGYVQKGANYRACALLGMTHGTSFDFNGDLPMGMPITFGVQNAEHEAKDWANSRFLLLVGSNPVETRIPDVHFIFDAVERGARLVVIDPTFSPTAAKADAHLRITPGTDAALALAMCRQIIEDGAWDADFMATYTDAALLVRKDTGVRLREADLVAGGSAERFAAWDTATGAPVIVGTDRLGFADGVRPALEGSWTVTLADGSIVDATPGFALVREELARWTPEAAAEVTGVDPDLIVKVARAYAGAKPAAILMGGGSNHWYHGDLTGRAFALLAALTGNIGRSGGGFSVYVGQYKVRVDTSPWWSPGGTKAHVVPSIYFVRGRTETMHPDVPYPEQGWHGLVCTFANMFVQAMDVNRLHETLAGLDLVVVVDHQMTETVKWADVVLPATTWYEKTDLTATPLHPFLQLQQAAIEPVGESRSELWMWRELVRRLDPAKAAEFFEMDEEAAIEAILAAGDVPGGPTEGITLDMLKAGPVRLHGPGPGHPVREAGRDAGAVPAALAAGAARGHGGVHPHRAHRVLQGGAAVPGPRRDGPHLQAALRRHRPRPEEVAACAAHAAQQVADPQLLRQQRLAGGDHGRQAGGVHLARRTRSRAASRRATRSASSTRAERSWPGRTSPRPSSRARSTLYEGWWPRQFKSGKGVNELTSSAVNPIHEVHFVGNMWAPSTGWKDCRCEIEKAGEA